MSWESDVNTFLQNKITNGVILDGDIRGVKEDAFTSIVVIWMFDDEVPPNVHEKWYFVYKDDLDQIKFSKLIGHDDIIIPDILD